MILIDTLTTTSRSSRSALPGEKDLAATLPAPSLLLQVIRTDRIARFGEDGGTVHAQKLRDTRSASCSCKQEPAERLLQVRKPSEISGGFGTQTGRLGQAKTRRINQFDGVLGRMEPAQILFGARRFTPFPPGEEFIQNGSE